jgi:hypothetical protein
MAEMGKAAHGYLQDSKGGQHFGVSQRLHMPRI